MFTKVLSREVPQQSDFHRKIFPFEDCIYRGVESTGIVKQLNCSNCLAHSTIKHSCWCIDSVTSPVVAVRYASTVLVMTEARICLIFPSARINFAMISSDFAFCWKSFSLVVALLDFGLISSVVPTSDRTCRAELVDVFLLLISGGDA
jgi:hypothetical protein